MPLLPFGIHSPPNCFGLVLSQEIGQIIALADELADPLEGNLPFFESQKTTKSKHRSTILVENMTYGHMAGHIHNKHHWDFLSA